MKKEVKYRLIKHISFLENELKDYGLFKTLSWKEYDEQRNKRRNVERFVSETGPLYGQFVDQAKGYLKSKILEAEEMA